MTSAWWARKTVRFLIAVIVSVGGVGLFTWVSRHGDPASRALLGADWQCANYVVLTSCSPVQGASPIVHTPRKRAVLARWV